ncbi:MAG TPA: alpha/beta hydrolase [Nitrospira sp.]|nr:alpha/beta hydrolase [Nitrospira sp.]
MITTGVRATALVALGAAIAGLGAITHSYQGAVQQARGRVAGGSRIAHTSFGPIEYAVAGDGPPVLVVHGAGGGFDQGMDLGAPLVERGFRVIAMSRFGYLRTPLPHDASPAAQADAHACLLGTLGIDHVAILGASAGAPSSLQFALRHPGRITALVLLVPAAYVPRPGGVPAVHTPSCTQFLLDTALRSDFLLWTVSTFARETAIRTILATPPDAVLNASADEQARVQKMLDHLLPISQRRLGLLNEAAVIPGIPRYELERIHVPTLTISCADDLFGTYDVARYTAEHVPGAGFVGYPTGGHLLVGHQHEAVDEIVRFLKK